MAHRVAPLAEVDLDDIWLRVAKESGSMDVATRLVDSITKRFFSSRPFPTRAAPVMEISAPGCEASPWASTSSCIGWKVMMCSSSAWYTANAILKRCLTVDPADSSLRRGPNPGLGRSLSVNYRHRERPQFDRRPSQRPGVRRGGGIDYRYLGIGPLFL